MTAGAACQPWLTNGRRGFVSMSRQFDAGRGACGFSRRRESLSGRALSCRSDSLSGRQVQTSLHLPDHGAPVRAGAEGFRGGNV